jgi:hypothetical protein
VPPFVGVAVNITDVPEHMAPDGDAEIVTAAATVGFTVIVIALEVAGLPDEHVKLEVITTVTIFPFASVDDVYVLPLVPTLAPLSFH